MAEIRLMRIEDWEDAVSLWRTSDWIGLNSEDDSKEKIDNFLRRNPGASFVAVENGKIIGTVLSGRDGRRSHIYHLAVSKEHRRKGVGRALVNAVIDALRAEGVRKVSLLSFRENREGAFFWDDMGFHIRPDLDYRDKTL